MSNLVTEIINYVVNTPENTNYLVLLPMLEELIRRSLGGIRLYIEDGDLYAEYPDDSNIEFMIDSSGNLIYIMED